MSIRRLALAGLAAGGAATATRHNGFPHAGLTPLIAVPATTLYDVPMQAGMPTKTYAVATLANTSVVPPVQTHESSPFENDDFQQRYATPIGATAIGLAVASLPFAVALRATRKRSATEADAEAGDIGATERTATLQETRRPAAPASATAGMQDVSILPPVRRFSEMLAKAASGALAIWKTTDVYTGLHAGDDNALRKEMMNPSDGRVSLPERNAQLVAWENAIQHLDLPDDLKRHFDESIKDTLAAIDRLIKDANPWSRATKLVAQSILCTPLPVVLPLFAVPMERQQADVIIASYAKTTMLRIGLATRGAAHDNAINNLYLNRDYANIIQSIALSLNLFGETRAVANNPSFSVGAAVVSAGILAYTFYPDQLKSLPGSILRLVNQVASYITGQSLPPREQTARVGGVGADAVSDDSNARLAALAKEVFGARKDLAAQRSHFTDSQRTLSDTADWQFGQMLKAYYKLGTELEAFTATGEQTGGIIHDSDRAVKLALAVLSGSICIGVTVLFRQNQITAVDMGVDALFNLYNGFNKALDSDVSWQEALDTFKNWTSLSLVMAPLQAANLAAGKLVQRSDRNMLSGAATLTAANFLVAGPFGAAVKAVVTQALARVQAQACQHALGMETTRGLERAASAKTETGVPAAETIETVAPAVSLNKLTGADESIADEWKREMMDFL